MKYRVLKKGGRFFPQVKKNLRWNNIQEESYDPRDHESFKLDKDFASEKAAIDFIKKWHSENMDEERVVSEFELP